MKKRITVKDMCGVIRNYEIINKEFFRDFVTNATTPETLVIWLGLAEAGGYIKKIV